MKYFLLGLLKFVVFIVSAPLLFIYVLLKLFYIHGGGSPTLTGYERKINDFLSSAP